MRSKTDGGKYRYHGLARGEFHNKRILKTVIIRLLLTSYLLGGFFSVGVLSEGVPLIDIKLAVNKKSLNQDESLAYKLVISSKVKLNNHQIKLPPIEKDFHVISSRQTQNISLSGKKMSLEIVQEYVLMPKKTGKIVIAPAELSYQGKVYRSEGVTINVNHSKKVIPEAPEEKKIIEEDFGKPKITL